MSASSSTSRASAPKVSSTRPQEQTEPSLPAPAKHSTALALTDKRALQRLNTLSPGQDLSAYLNTIQSIEVLSTEEERRLAHRFRNDGDMEAARLLVLANLRFVAHIARTYMGYGLPQGDIIQEGNIGLMKAVQHFDPEMGNRLISFAVQWIKSDIHDYVLRNWSIVKIATTKAQRKLFFNLRKKKKSLDWLSDTEAEAIADELKVTAKDVRQMEQRMAGRDIPLPLPGSNQDDNADSAPALPEPQGPTGNEPEERVIDEIDSEYRLQQLNDALDHLDERSKDIIEQRWLGERKMGLQELADQYGVSAERIRQIEAAAMKQVRQSLQDAGLTLDTEASQ